MSCVATARMGRGRNVYIAVHASPLIIKVGQDGQVTATIAEQLVFADTRLDGARVWTYREPASAPRTTRVPVIPDRGTGLKAMFVALDEFGTDARPRSRRSAPVTVEVPAGARVHIQLAGRFEDQTGGAAEVVDFRDN